jgi:VIT1/CCC1 family predicted Fe2+/Mn2+ transporter
MSIASGAGSGAAPVPAADVVERAAVREILMGAQDNLTNVLAVMLGVSIGVGRSDIVALAGASAAVAEAVSMGGVLYSSTRAENNRRRLAGGAAPTSGLGPAASGMLTFMAALIGGFLPLAPFLVLPLPTAVVSSIAVSLTALFTLGAWTGRLTGVVWWRDGLRLVAVAGAAAVAAAAVGTLLRVE